MYDSNTIITNNIAKVLCREGQPDPLTVSDGTGLSLAGTVISFIFEPERFKPPRF